jgi:tetratricopeptide (TPR) repeat protein
MQLPGKRRGTATQSIHELRVVDRWHREVLAAAGRLLPALLDLSGPSLAAELERHRELRSGIIQLLLGVVQDAAERCPRRAHELTAVLVAHADVDVLPAGILFARYLKGQVFTAHAAALRALGRHEEASQAIAMALALFEQGLGSAWHIAVARVVEAQILHDRGERAEALGRIGQAAEVILEYGDRERYVQARMTEAWMHWDAGDPAAAADVWRAAAGQASRQRDPVLLAQLDRRIGIFLLCHGSPELAARHFTAAQEAFAAAGQTRDAVRTRWNLAEAAAARGRFHEAVSEYYKVQALLLAGGDVIDAALASAEILELLLIAGRHTEVLSCAERLVPTLAEAGLTLTAMRAWIWVRSRARAGLLTRDDLAAVRRYFEDLPLHPNAPFPSE